MKHISLDNLRKIKSIILKDGRKYSIGVNGVKEFRSTHIQKTPIGSLDFDLEIITDMDVSFLQVDIDFIASILYREET